jgi:hypothetical protein
VQIAPSRIKIASVHAGSVLAVIHIFDSEPTAGMNATAAEVAAQMHRVQGLADNFTALVSNTSTLFNIGYTIEALKMDVLGTSDLSNSTNATDGGATTVFLGSEADLLFPSISASPLPRIGGSEYILGSLTATIGISVAIGVSVLLLGVVSVVLFTRSRRKLAPNVFTYDPLIIMRDVGLSSGLNGVSLSWLWFQSQD